MPESRATTLHPIGSSLLDGDGRPRFGQYRGIPDDFSYRGLRGEHHLDPLRASLRRKRWYYGFAATDDIIVVTAIVAAGAAATTFVMVTDRVTGQPLANISRPGLGVLTHVADQLAEPLQARSLAPCLHASVTDEGAELRWQVTARPLPAIPLLTPPAVEVDLRFDRTAAAAITAVGELRTDPPQVTATVKQAALPVRGRVTVRGDQGSTTFDLSSGIGGYDYTNGFLPRHTAWRWAFLSDRLPDGRALGMNLVAGFSGQEDRAHENALWLGDDVVSIDPRVRITYTDPAQPWQVRTGDGAVDLRFRPLSVHREAVNLGLVRSRFIQPTGHFSGTIRAGGQTVHLHEVPGVVEDQDVVW